MGLICHFHTSPTSSKKGKHLYYKRIFNVNEYIQIQYNLFNFGEKHSPQCYKTVDIFLIYLLFSKIFKDFDFRFGTAHRWSWAMSGTVLSQADHCPGWCWVRLSTVRDGAEFSWALSGTARRWSWAMSGTVLSPAECCLGWCWVQLSAVRDSAESGWVLSRIVLSSIERCPGQFWVRLSAVRAPGWCWVSWIERCPGWYWVWLSAIRGLLWAKWSTHCLSKCSKAC